MFSCQKKKDHTKILVENPGGINTFDYWQPNPMPRQILWRYIKGRQQHQTVWTGTSETLVNLDITGLSGIFKHGFSNKNFYQKLIWLFMLYNIVITTVEGNERKINKHLWRWMGVPQSFSSTALTINISGRRKLDSQWPWKTRVTKMWEKLEPIQSQNTNGEQTM